MQLVEWLALPVKSREFRRADWKKFELADLESDLVTWRELLGIDERLVDRTANQTRFRVQSGCTLIKISATFKWIPVDSNGFLVDSSGFK